MNNLPSSKSGLAAKVTSIAISYPYSFIWSAALKFASRMLRRDYAATLTVIASFTTNILAAPSRNPRVIKAAEIARM